MNCKNCKRPIKNCGLGGECHGKGYVHEESDMHECGGGYGEAQAEPA